MRYRVSVEPTSEPVTLAQVKAHLRIDHSLDDTMLTTLITTARVHVENYVRRALFTQTIVATWDYFPSFFSLEKPALSSVTSITYIDSNGDLQTLSAANYQVDTTSAPGKITLAYGYTWPSTRPIPAAVTVTYVAGHSTVAAIPDTIKHAMLMLIGHWYENREAIGVTVGQLAELPFAVESLLMPYKVY